jgi:hypothetical protein
MVPKERGIVTQVLDSFFFFFETNFCWPRHLLVICEFRVRFSISLVLTPSMRGAWAKHRGTPWDPMELAMWAKSVSLWVRISKGWSWKSKLSKLYGFELLIFRTELPYFPKPRWITHLQISHGARYNSYLLNGTKSEHFPCRVSPLAQLKTSKQRLIGTSRKTAIHLNKVQLVWHH